MHNQMSNSYVRRKIKFWYKNPKTREISLVTSYTTMAKYIILIASIIVHVSYQTNAFGT